ncbi:hypothetical protein CF335_g9394 [Tilletia laevis]|nr:hypothetical protein CF335_g9394 [Tilletia laevis]
MLFSPTPSLSRSPPRPSLVAVTDTHALDIAFAFLLDIDIDIDTDTDLAFPSDLIFHLDLDLDVSPFRRHSLSSPTLLDTAHPFRFLLLPIRQGESSHRVFHATH